MKVKVGDEIYSSEDQPIMVVLTDEAKYRITHMLPEAMRYAEFPDHLGWTDGEKLAWMTGEEMVK